MKVWIPHQQGRELLGRLSEEVTVEVMTDPTRLPSDPAGVRFWVPPFLARPGVAELAGKLPDLRVVQLLSAGADAWAGRLPEQVTLCDARGVHDSSTAEWVATAVLTHVRDFAGFVRAQSHRQWSYETFAPTDEVAGKRILIVGAGSIGAAVRSRLAPFEVEFTLVARNARPAEQVHAVTELPRLLPYADIVVLLVPLTAATRGLVDAAFLATMRDGSLLVNAARGPVVDTAALTAELATGRISAVLDVTDPEPLPADHPLWSFSNVVISPHIAGSVRGLLARAYGLAERQIRRFVAGDELRNVVTEGY
ncbi:2-hydroxyacid dehydrogenase [Solwaraspora sp. WMMD406]|uniref:2-hydroxyacid dehydrogenase n=1 Tax=Solwaraspora sp. WMMD406 TaxID=3016095 RepID=UPI002417208F|nr:2-hydroxyacid dehydrogenase [Solwaraspora sp. WMMD406]MDG4767309.1 2-hydroxyacid dehydrogenase [Solwaraspora sp. WMMD406]